MIYDLEGSLLEVCTCNVLCPCWIGENPDGGTCDAIVSYHFDRGVINGVDVSGLSLANLCKIPGNVLHGNWKVVVYLDEKASSQQETAILNVFTGRLGGPVADLAKLIGQVVGVHRAPIQFEVEEGKGRLRVGADIEAEMSPFKGATGQVTKLQDTVFSTIAGAPAYVSKASTFKAKQADLGFNIDLSEHNAVQGRFRFQA